MTESITAPDAPAYVDLSLYDADEQDLVDRALADAATKLPEWIPREGNTEVVLTEALALLVAETVFALNRLPAVVLQALLVLYGVSRDAGVPTAGRVEFTVSDTVGHVIPAGTRLRATLTTGEDVDLLTVEPLEILAAATTGEVDVAAAEPGDTGNGLAAGTVLDVVDAVAFVNSVELVTALAGGRDPETDEQLYDRGAALLSRLVSTLVLPDHFTAAALEDPSVARAYTLDRLDLGQPGVPGDHQGHVTVAVADAAGAPLSSTIKNAILADLTARSLAGLNVHIIDPGLAAVPVTVTVTRVSGTSAALQAAIEAAIRAYLNPATWPWLGTVYINEMISLVDQVPGVGRVVDLRLNGAPTDLVLASFYPTLAVASTVAVTIT